ncbi:MAG: DUF4838 domain-containing protein [Kofleriaceae bacterium]|nr:DUF4838 domain-containing protein [Kofleriaceae bacterium]
MALLWACTSESVTPPDAPKPQLYIIQGGHSDYAIVTPDTPTPAEAHAASELAAFLAQATGATLPVVAESAFAGGHGLYLGHTRFAAMNGVPLDELGPDEWVMQTVGNELVLAGGRPRGALYGAYELLEQYAGVRFLAAHRTYVPPATDVHVDVDLAERTTPAFAQRQVFMLAGGNGSAPHDLFRVRRKLTTNATEYPLEPTYGDTLMYGRPYLTHTHHHYSTNFPPEYFALRPGGSRTGPGPGGQVDMTNPQVRDLFTAQLRAYIQQDRADATAHGVPAPTVYDLTPNDNENKCTCETCMALAAKYGSYAGVVLDFTNDIAARIEADYPDVRVQTSAYTFYADAPRGIAPRANVSVKLAQLGAEFITTPARDTVRSMADPINEGPRQMIDAWSALSPALGVHDYWKVWNQQYQWPQANIHALAETLALYHQAKVRNFFVEDELFGSRLHTFVDLQLYLASRLLQDPGQAPDPIIDEFMATYYGPAAPPMRGLLDYLEQRQAEEPGILATVQPADRAYFDASFFLETDRLLTEAELLASGDEALQRDIRQERLAIDETMLYLWDELAAEAGTAWTFDRAAIVDRLSQSYSAAYAKYGGWGAAMRADDERRLAFLRDKPPVPTQFQGSRIIDLVGPGLALATGGPAVLVDDPEAAAGKAWRLDATMNGAAGDHSLPPTLGFYEPTTGDVQTRTLAAAEIPTDEKFHFHLVGRTRATQTLWFWAHHSWWLSRALSAAYHGGLATQRSYDVYASLKLEGPGYVAGSLRTSAFSIDRLILVEVP